MRILPVILVSVSIALSACGPADRADDTAASYRNLSSDVEYVGKETCGQCHADKFSTFTESQMGRSFKPGLLEESAAEWEQAEPVYDPHSDLYYQAFSRNEELFVTEFRIANGDTIHKRTEKIDYIVGSGQHTNSHMMDVNGYLYQIPLTWYAQDGKWDLPPGFENNNSRFSRPITQACMGCHNAISGFVFGSENRFAELPHGIDCERCHGPGELHVTEKTSGEFVDVEREIDYSIVNPGKLPIERQLDVCQRCHMQGATVYEEGKTPFDYRPGMDLASIMNVYSPRYSDSTSRFIMASHPDRLQMSECFIGSREGASQVRAVAPGQDGSPHPEVLSRSGAASIEPMTCTTCHDPHLPIETLGREHYQLVCQSCHSPANDQESPSQIRASSTSPSIVASRRTAVGPCTAPMARRLEQGDDCVACHMPKSGSIDIPHVSVTDHNIRVVEAPEVGGKVTDEEFVGLVSLIRDDASDIDMAAGYMTYFEEVSDIPYFLDSAAVHLERAKSDLTNGELAPYLVQLWFLQQDFNAIIALTQDIDPLLFQNAWTFYRIGQAYDAVGDLAGAIDFFRRAVEREPEHLRFKNRLGMAYTSLGRLDEAVEMFDSVLESNPKFGDAYNNRGFARAMQGDLSGAERDFLEAINLDPDAYQALANLASLYVNLGDKDQAREIVQRLLAHDPDHEGYQHLMSFLE